MEDLNSMGLHFNVQSHSVKYHHDGPAPNTIKFFILP